MFNSPQRSIGLTRRKPTVSDAYTWSSCRNIVSSEVGMKIVLLLLCGLVSTGVISGQTIPKPIHTGTDFLETCKHFEEDAGPYTTVSYTCLAWANGFWEALLSFDSFQEHMNNGQRQICEPTNMTTGQVVRIIQKFIRDNPAIENDQIGILGLRALREAFGCKTK
jgi:hypothetical protein